jgi:hypothetical protein
MNSVLQYVDKLLLTTPKVKFKYPKLVEPETKFNPEGVYKVTAIIPAAEAADIADQLDNLLEAHKASLKAQSPTTKFKLVEPGYGFQDIDGEPCFALTPKMKAKGVSRDGRSWSAAPALFDAKGGAIKDRDSLRGMWSGTIGRVSFEVCPFYQPGIGVGLSLRLKAVQIIELVESGGTADAFGFQEEEGYAATSVEGPVPFDSTKEVDDGGYDF